MSLCVLQMLEFMQNRGVVAEKTPHPSLTPRTSFTPSGGSQAVGVFYHGAMVLALPHALTLYRSYDYYIRHLPPGDTGPRFKHDWEQKSLSLDKYITTSEHGGATVRFPEPHPSGLQLTFRHISHYTLMHGTVHPALVVPALALLFPVIEQTSTHADFDSRMHTCWPSV